MKKENRKSYKNKNVKAYHIGFVKTCEAIGIKPLTISEGNMKYHNSEKIRFIIWNLPYKSTCPFATEVCKKICYAKKAETAYPDCNPSRVAHFEESKRNDFALRMAYTILSIAMKDRTGRKVVVRIHESGDFYNLDYLKKWLDVMDMCKGANVQFLAYTKSFPFFDGRELPKNFSLRASIMEDTPQWLMDIINRNGWKTYRAVEKFNKGDKFTRCRCKDCATCKKCWSNYSDIRCEIH